MQEKESAYVNIQAKDVYFVGDIHGNVPSLENAINVREIQQNSVLILLGDIGIFTWSPTLDALQEMAYKYNIRLYLLRGNHDDPFYWNKYHKYDSHITFIKDFSKLLINGETRVFAIGGGLSLDRSVRKEGVDYFKDEMIKPMPSGMPYIDCDVLITHTGIIDGLRGLPEPSKRYWCLKDNMLEADLAVERETMLFILKNISAKAWVYGHFHETKVFPAVGGLGVSRCVLGEIEIMSLKNILSIDAKHE